jgi:hypothetical protein
MLSLPQGQSSDLVFHPWSHGWNVNSQWNLKSGTLVYFEERGLMSLHQPYDDIVALAQVVAC